MKKNEIIEKRPNKRYRRASHFSPDGSRKYGEDVMSDPIINNRVMSGSYEASLITNSDQETSVIMD